MSAGSLEFLDIEIPTKENVDVTILQSSKQLVS